MRKRQVSEFNTLSKGIDIDDFGEHILNLALITQYFQQDAVPLRNENKVRTFTIIAAARPK